MSWRDKAKEVLGSRHDRHDRAQKPPEAPNVPNVPNVPDYAPRNPAKALKQWHAHLSGLDLRQPPSGVDGKEWAQACEDSWWLYENFAGVAVRQGWGAAGLFGVRPGYPAGGGLAHSLQGCRKLVLDGPHAHFTSYGVRFRRNAACGEGLSLIWELAQ